jgi:putative methyltransferase (TIGR04325 family)
MAARAFRENRVGGNPFYGVYASLDEARGAIPDGAPASYDNGASSELYRERTERVYLHDYPVLFWMNELLPKVRRVFDLGGHVGIARYAYEPYLPRLPDLSWTVCDVPAVVEAGRRLATARRPRGLGFTSTYEDADGADVLFASGVLQYLPAGFLGDLLARLPSPPPHVIVNITPTTPEETFYTLNNIGTAICPYVVVNERAFLAGLVRSGYRLADDWSAPDKKCVIPLHPGRNPTYRGFYLRRVAATDSLGAAAAAPGMTAQ